ncbi:MAG: hypothetical protein MI975_00495 [Cytophagales bacterium]|nr:hypothetical protein [Cytophagales bacterium]
MFNFFKNKRKAKESAHQLMDINGDVIREGDRVYSYRYELGDCIIVSGEHGLDYESIETKKRVNWTLMIDAATERQKVRKLTGQ